jgi:hypothetical protein
MSWVLAMQVISWEEVLCLLTATKLTGTEWWVTLKGRALGLLAESSIRLGRYVHAANVLRPTSQHRKLRPTLLLLLSGFCAHYRCGMPRSCS